MISETSETKSPSKDLHFSARVAGGISSSVDSSVFPSTTSNASSFSSEVFISGTITMAQSSTGDDSGLGYSSGTVSSLRRN